MMNSVEMTIASSIQMAELMLQVQTALPELPSRKWAIKIVRDAVLLADPTINCQLRPSRASKKLWGLRKFYYEVQRCVMVLDIEDLIAGRITLLFLCMTQGGTKVVVQSYSRVSISKGVIPFTCFAFKLILKVLNISSTTSNCPSLQTIWNRIFHYVRLIHAGRLLDTLEYVAICFIEISYEFCSTLYNKVKLCLCLQNRN